VSTKAALKRLALANIGSIDARTELDRVFATLDDATLHALASAVRLVEPQQSVDRDVLIEALLLRHERRAPPEAAVSTLPLYPSDEVRCFCVLMFARVCQSRC
jgi:hypothetical protein